MSNEQGFTLLELLIVLLIISTVFMFVLPSMAKTVNRQAHLHFFDELNSNIFFMQNYVLNRGKSSVINIQRNRYRFSRSYSWTTHPYPDNLRGPDILGKIEYSTKGSIKQPDSYIFSSDNIRYKVIFPFGKGRGYIVE